MDFDEIGEGRGKLQPLRALCMVTGVTAVVIHHLNKDTRQGKTNRNRLAGSHQLMAAASGDWTLHTEFAPDGARMINVSYHARMFGRGEFQVRSTGLGSFTLVEEDVRDEASERLVRVLARRVGETVTRQEIEKIANVSPTTAGEYIKKLRARRILRHDGRRGPHQGYVVVGGEDDSE